MSPFNIALLLVADVPRQEIGNVNGSKRRTEQLNRQIEMKQYTS